RVKLNTLFQKMGALNKFRNRLFHHEPAWKGRSTRNRVDAIEFLLKMFNEHTDAIYLLSTSKRDLITVLGFEDKFNQECNIKSLERFEALLSPTN
ncbi:hypothetical protein AB4619_25255, partial [Vibrio splendidus]